MLTHSRNPLAPAVCSLLAAVCSVSFLHAAEEKTFTQIPKIAPSQVRGEPATQPKETPRPRGDIFTQGPKPLWIWGADDNRRYDLRKEFPGGSTAARMKATCDNRMTLVLNGKEIASGDNWQTPVEVDVQKYLKPGNNVLVARVTNEGGPAGFLLKLVLTMPDGKKRYLVSDDSWQASEKKDDKPVAVRKIGKLGEGPWGDMFAGFAQTAASNVFNVLPGFQVERLFTVPRGTLGSWVSITFDNKGRLIASDEGGKGLCRITPPPIGSSDEVKVEHLDVKITAAQGLLYAFDSLYVCVNGGPGSGLYRLRDTKGNDQYDEVVKLRPLAGGGEHGPHGVVRSPDGKSIFLVAGNFTDLPAKLTGSRVPRNWSEDLLLPRQWDGNGFARGRLAPGGWIARTDAEGKSFEVFSIGYRNAYRTAFNADGELFAYDSDMEWDMGMPWYRPTRTMHAVSGSDFGWRSGTGKWPAYYVDSLPPLLNIGPGSPVGMSFGYGTKFPAKYQKALYLLDWTFGTIYALHLTPDGSSYKAVKEEFLSRTPLPLTDIAIGPDGALYFTIGGRGTQSELFRVTYVGKEATAPVEVRDPRNADLRALRHKIEKYHEPGSDAAKAVEFVYPHLGHGDRFIRHAARVALEHQKPDLWQDRVLDEKDAETLITGAVALARQGGKSLQGRLLAALARLDFAKLTEVQQVELLRAYQLVFVRMGEPDAATAAGLAKTFDAFYPSGSESLDRELVSLLIYLKSPTVLAKTIEEMRKPSKKTNEERMDELLARNRGYGGTIANVLANGADLQKLHYLLVLRNVRDGWTLEQHKFYFQWLADARKHSGGASYQNFLNNIEKEAFDNASEADRLAIEAAGLRKPFQLKELPKPKGPGRDWKLAELVSFAEPKLKGRDFKNGQKMYAAARCVVCHRFNGEGGATGPDLSQVAGRFNLKDLCESIVEPSKVISDQYRASVVSTKKGKEYVGRIIAETKDALTILLDPEDSTKVVEVKQGDVDEKKPSPTSVMPDGLLKALNEEEALDLIAYLLSHGDRNNPMFKK
ncbi:MAG TPA: c-type cytochrome [Gemmataceae bacterium]|jgi:putative heme-binding domain-containing protein